MWFRPAEQKPETCRSDCYFQKDEFLTDLKVLKTKSQNFFEIHMLTAQLYDLADELYRLAPWQWMFEDELIGLRHPGTKELAQISIMGANGQHISLALYLGEEALLRFNTMHQELPEGEELPQEDGMALVLESRQLQVSFGDRGELSKAELAEIKRLKRKYRGGNYPQFQSFHPGRCPRSINDKEAEWLVHALTQTKEVALMLRAGLIAHKRTGKQGLESITREFHDGVWRTTWVPTDSRTFDFPAPAPDTSLVAKVAQHPGSDVDCHFQIIPNPIGASRENSVFPYLALSVDRNSGFIFGMELISVEEQPHEQMIASVPDHFLRQWDRQQLRPTSLRVATRGTHAMLEKTAAELGIPLVLDAELPALQAALSSVMRSLGHDDDF